MMYTWGHLYIHLKETLMETYIGGRLHSALAYIGSQDEHLIPFHIEVDNYNHDENIFVGLIFMSKKCSQSDFDCTCYDKDWSKGGVKVE